MPAQVAPQLDIDQATIDAVAEGLQSVRWRSPVVEACLQDDEVVAVDEVDQSVFVADSP